MILDKCSKGEVGLPQVLSESATRKKLAVNLQYGTLLTIVSSVLKTDFYETGVAKISSSKK